ncbi:MAG: hypothetical protein ACE14V_01590 [bacterium]
MKKPILILTLVYLVLLIFIFHPRISGNDEIGYYVYLRSAVFDRDFDFTNEFEYYKNSYLIVGYSPVTGKPVNGLPIGSAVLWLPFFLLAHIGIWISHLWGSSISMDGYSKPYVDAICFGSSYYAFLGILLIFQLARKIFSTINKVSIKTIVVSIILFWLSSPLIFYMYLQPAMAHANSVFAVSLFFYLWYRYRNQDTWLKWLLLGLSGCLMTLVRFQDAIFLIIPWLDYCINQDRNNRKRFVVIIRNIAVFLIAFILFFIPQLIAWKAIFGSYFSGPESHSIVSGTNIMHPHLIAILFSGRHGLITWNPIILLSIFGAIWFWKKVPSVISMLGFVFILQMYLISCWHEWWGAHSFGHRMFLSSTPFFIIGLIAFINRIKQRINWRWIYGISILFILWNFGLIAQYSLGIIDRDGTTPFQIVIYNQFMVVPLQLKNILHYFIP